MNNTDLLERLKAAIAPSIDHWQAEAGAGAGASMSDEFDNALKRVIQGAQKQWQDLHRDFPELQVCLHDADLVAYAAAHGLVLEDLTAAQKQEAFTDAVLAMSRQETP